MSCINSSLWKSGILDPITHISQIQDNLKTMATMNCNCESVVLQNNLTNLECEQYFPVHSSLVQFVYYTIFTFIVTVSLAGNITVIWIVLGHRQMHYATNYFLLNLAAADITVILTNMCFSFQQNFYYDWFFPHWCCPLVNFMGITPTCTSVFTMMIMSLDRWWAIFNPFRRPLKTKMALAIVGCIWLVSILIGSPNLFFSGTTVTFYQTGQVKTVCEQQAWPPGPSLDIYNYTVLVLQYIIPSIVLLCTYISIAFILLHGSTIGDTCHEQSMKTKKKVIKMMAVVVTIFLMCWLPYHATFTFLASVLSRLPQYYQLHIYVNIYMFAMSAAMYNPIIYCTMNKKFRIGFCYAFRWLPCLNFSVEEYQQCELFGKPKGNYHSMQTARKSTVSTPGKIIDPTESALASKMENELMVPIVTGSYLQVSSRSLNDNSFDKRRKTMNISRKLATSTPCSEIELDEYSNFL